MESLKQTPLLPQHQQERAKLVPFAGWQMPLEYQSILEEHLLVRNDKGLFDLSHMGEIEVSGQDALSYLQSLVPSQISERKEGQALYTVMCREDGGMLDDLVIYRFSNKFMLVVNASNIDKISSWMKRHLPNQKDVVLRDRSDRIALLAVQGPNAGTFLQPLTTIALQSIPYYHFVEGKLLNIPMIISRTGYTGEDGYELYIDAKIACEVWESLRSRGIALIGLGARDTLRLEAGYLLYGNDMDESTSPLEVGLGWVVRAKEDYIGKEFLKKQKEEGVPRKLIAFAMEDRGVPRSHYAIYVKGQKVGEVTSGTFSPSLRKGIGMGLIQANELTRSLKEGEKLQIEIRGEKHPAIIVKRPFVKGSVKCGT